MSSSSMDHIDNYICCFQQISAEYSDYMNIIEEALVLHFNRSFYGDEEYSVDYILKTALTYVVNHLRECGVCYLTLPQIIVLPKQNKPKIKHEDLMQVLACRGNTTCLSALLNLAQDLQLSEQFSDVSKMGQGLPQQTYSGMRLASAAPTMQQTGYPSLQNQQGFANMATPVHSAGGYTSSDLRQVAGQTDQHQTVFSPVSTTPPDVHAEPAHEAPVTTRDLTPAEAKAIKKPTIAALVAGSAAHTSQKESVPGSRQMGPSNQQEARGYWSGNPRTMDDCLPSTSQETLQVQCRELWSHFINAIQVNHRSHYLVDAPAFGIPVPRGFDWNEEFQPYLDDLKDHWGAVHFRLVPFHKVNYQRLDQNYIVLNLECSVEGDKPLRARPGLVRQLWDAHRCVMAWREAMVSSGHSIYFQYFADDWAGARLPRETTENAELLNTAELLLSSDWDANLQVGPPLRTRSLEEIVKPRARQLESSTKRYTVCKESAAPYETEKYQTDKEIAATPQSNRVMKADKTNETQRLESKKDTKKSSSQGPMLTGDAMVAQQRQAFEQFFRDCEEKLASTAKDRVTETVQVILDDLYVQSEETIIPYEVMDLFRDLKGAILFVPAAMKDPELRKQVAKKLNDFQRVLRRHLAVIIMNDNDLYEDLKPANTNSAYKKEPHVVPTSDKFGLLEPFYPVPRPPLLDANKPEKGDDKSSIGQTTDEDPASDMEPFGELKTKKAVSKKRSGTG
ncbi:hypothetical protein VMCG_08402 [Cytospora schulzeri]|uniref:Uncharacterized protein n=1 Tax=Cytospora schulzeri TaxID=448051 RepID=A0A423VR24_9PEZI|nr:hypothetical protein VMCG_08402 [Valsa malicola]